MEIWQLNAGQWIIAGGPIMWPIIFCSIFAFGIVIERIFYFSTIKTDVQYLKTKLFDLIKGNEIKRAIELCEKNRSPVAKIFQAGIARFGSSREEIKEAMENVSLFEIPNLERHLAALATMAHILPLLGLLGTVAGMTSSFYSIQVRSSTLNPATPGDLAGGIWQALLTTVASLIVAIPVLAAYNYCVAQVNQFVSQMERAAAELLNFLCRLTETDTSQHAN